MQHLSHMCRDSGQGSKGTHATPSWPDNMRIPQKSPGPHGLHDAAHQDMSGSRADREYALLQLRNSAHAIKKSRHELTHVVQQRFGSAGTDPSGNSSGPPNQALRIIAHGNMQPPGSDQGDAAGWVEPTPDWLPAELFEKHMGLIQEFNRLMKACFSEDDLTLGGIESGGVSLDETCRTLCHVYSLSDYDLNNPVATGQQELSAASKSMDRLLKSLRSTALKMAVSNLVEKWALWRVASFTRMNRLDVYNALSLFITLLIEWPAETGRTPYEVEKALQALELVNIRYRRITVGGAGIILLTDL